MDVCIGVSEMVAWDIINYHWTLVQLCVAVSDVNRAQGRQFNQIGGTLGTACLYLT